MLKTKRQTKLDLAAAEAKPEVAEQSSAAYASTIARLRARRDQVEDRLQQIAGERHKLMVDGADDAVVDRLRQEHRGLEVEVDDLEAAIKIAEGRREIALVRERAAAFDRRGDRLRSEALPGLEADYRRFLDLGRELAGLAEKIATVEAEIRGFNVEAIERKRHDLRISNHARARAGGADVDAPLERPQRMSGESDAAYQLRAANVQARRGDAARRGEAFRVLAAQLIEPIGRIGFATSSPRPLRLIETFRTIRGSEAIEAIRNAETGGIIAEQPINAAQIKEKAANV